MARSEQGQGVAAQAGRASDRAARFIARVDAHLPSLKDDAARRRFLERQLDGWERRYARFVSTEGESEFHADTADPPQAADFVLTIAEVAARRDALAQRKDARV